MFLQCINESDDDDDDDDDVSVIAECPGLQISMFFKIHPLLLVGAHY